MPALEQHLSCMTWINETNVGKWPLAFQSQGRNILLSIDSILEHFLFIKVATPPQVSHVLGCLYDSWNIDTRRGDRQTDRQMEKISWDFHFQAIGLDRWEKHRAKSAVVRQRPAGCMWGWESWLKFLCDADTKFSCNGSAIVSMSREGWGRSLQQTPAWSVELAE